MQLGKGDPSIYSGELDFIQLKAMLGGIEDEENFYQVAKDSPPEIKKKGAIGTNNLKGARAVNNFWQIKNSRNPQIDEKSYFGFEEKLHDAYDKLLED